MELELDYNGIQEYLCNRYPLLMIDHVDKVIPGVSAKGCKSLTDNDWFFKSHFPDEPIMPGILQLEALSQMCAMAIVTKDEYKGKIIKLASVQYAKFLRPAIPGDKLSIEAQIIFMKRGLVKAKGIGTIDGEIACKAEFLLICDESLAAYF